jgi:hypothetical protein
MGKSPADAPQGFFFARGAGKRKARPVRAAGLPGGLPVPWKIVNRKENRRLSHPGICGVVEVELPPF